MTNLCGYTCLSCIELKHLFFKFFFKFIIYLLFLFLAVLGLRFCARAFSSCGEWGPLFIAVRGPLTIAASLAAEQRLQTLRLSSCGSQAQLLCGMWDLPRPGLEPVSPALAGRFSTTAPPGKPWAQFYQHGRRPRDWQSSNTYSSPASGGPSWTFSGQALVKMARQGLGD